MDMGGLTKAITMNNAKLIAENHEHQVQPKKQQFLDAFIEKVSNPQLKNLQIEKSELE